MKNEKSSRKPIPFGTMQTFDKKTGKLIEEKKNAGFMLPAAEGTCETCATKHDEGQPHNAQSLFYQMRFQNENGRGATWQDAWAHCGALVQSHWKAELTSLGVDWQNGKINPVIK